MTYTRFAFHLIGDASMPMRGSSGLVGSRFNCYMGVNENLVMTLHSVVVWIHIGDTEDGMKDAGMRIRVEQDLRDAFVAACQKMDVPAAQVLREHMKAIVSKVDQSSKPTQKRKHGATR